MARRGRRKARAAAAAVAEPETVVEAIVQESAERGDSGALPPAALKKRELLRAVAMATGQPKRAVRPVIDAALAEIARALGEGRDLQLPPLGKLRNERIGGKSGVPVVSARIRLNTPDAATAQAAEEGTGAPEDGAQADADNPLAQAAE